jgi:ribosomal protein S18 acetylase RimI-like enzyme
VDESPRRARADDYATVVRVLARAFENDPVANYMMKRDHMERAFGTFFKHSVLPHDEAWLSGEDGVALWTPPGKWNATGLNLLAMAPTLLAAVGATKLVARARAAQRVSELHPREPHWYLFAIGVDPAMQGKGIGSKLIRVVMERCDAEKKAAYLEASTETNARLYERHGFAVTEELRVAKDAPPMWLMWRAAPE